ncbi:MAG: succinyl-diaminopimelate desuccinylase [Acidimicrobiia bacterium]|nr:MAG: succinyl-diaminopimelate desuccinylase [Acidimicrobiia bacterium]
MNELDLLVDTTKELIDVPSETGKEGRICTRIAARLLITYGDAGVRRVGNSLVVGNRTGRPMVLLVGHIDTVPSQGQGPARVEDGRIHGLGAADMKGGVAVMIHLLEDASVRTGPFDVIGVFYEGEEGPADQNGLAEVLRREPWLEEAEFAVVLEPTDGRVELGCNGVINARVTFLGVPAHSARPWTGENAISKAGAWLAEMHEREPVPVVVSGLEFKEVMSVTLARGGIASNIVPDRFDLNLNYRFSPSRSVEEALTVVRRVCAVADEVEIVDLAPAGKVDVDHPLLSSLLEASGTEPAPKQGWTDVARLTEAGIPAVNYGPGESTLAHKPEESLAVSDLARTYEVLRTILSLAR